MADQPAYRQPARLGRIARPLPLTYTEHAASTRAHTRTAIADRLQEAAGMNMADETASRLQEAAGTTGNREPVP